MVSLPDERGEGLVEGPVAGLALGDIAEARNETVHSFVGFCQSGGVQLGFSLSIMRQRQTQMPFQADIIQARDSPQPVTPARTITIKVGIKA